MPHYAWDGWDDGSVATKGLLEGERSPALEGALREASMTLGSVATLAFALDGRPFLRGEVGLPLAMVRYGETPLLDSLAMLVAAHDGPLIIEDAEHDSEQRADRVLHRLGVRSCLGTPLLGPRDRVLGSLCAIADSARIWSDEEVELIDQLGEAAAAEVIAGAEPGPAAELDAAKEAITAAFLRAEGSDEALGAALKSLCQRLDWDLAAAWLLDADQLRCGRCWHRPDASLHAFAELCRGMRLDRDADPVRAACEGGEPIWGTGLPAAADFQRLPVVKAAGITGGAWTPLLSGGSSLGALELLCLEPRPLHARVVPELLGIGAQLGELFSLRRYEEGAAGGPTPAPKSPFKGLPEPGEW